MKLREVIAYGTAAIMFAALTACSSGTSGDKETGSGAGVAKPSASPSYKSFAAPTRFSLDETILLPMSAGVGKSSMAKHPFPVALHNGAVFISRPDGLDAIHGYRKSFPVTITSEHDPMMKLKDAGSGFAANNPAEAPLITSFGRKTWVFNAVVTRVTGAGTAKSHDMVELMAVDTANAGTKAWFTEIALPDEYPSGDEAEAYVVGRGGDAIVVYARGQLFGVDLASHQRIWEAAGTYRKGAVIAGDRIVAMRKNSDSPQIVGLDAASGKDAWTSPRTSQELSAAGPDAVMTYEKAPNADGARNYLLDAATGAIRNTLPKDAPGSDCAYDGAAVTICTDGFVNPKVAAYDPKTGQELWRLPDTAGTRVAPHVRLVRAGLIYAMANGHPVVLDAASGKDKENQPGIAPYITDGYVGITESKDGTGATAYRAVG
ncbi:PQQ-binding-like beta-propeller repeat protein [Streptomyces sp. NPDC000405]|uniref:outer membrane protein assembly factor BamB family protein n=1 Tax=Streptomyces sp. NPDC000405 TaxID=3161033 RepID=UPI00398CB2FB